MQADAGPVGAADTVQRHVTYGALLRRTLVRLVLVYLVPLLVLTIFFHVEYRLVAEDAAARQRRALADREAALLDEFLGDRLLNLTGLADRPAALHAPRSDDLAASLARLRAESRAFVDLAVLDADGRVLAYAGPLPELTSRNYRSETWFSRLLAGDSLHVITDAYPGFRGEAHYTMALKVEPQGQVRVLRAVISPRETRAHLDARLAGGDDDGGGGLIPDVATNLWLVTAVFGGVGGGLMLLLAHWVARQQLAAHETERELNRRLVHAARLAVVGEITAGIAHEVNNPLAVVTEKVGLLRDRLDPRFGAAAAPDEMREHLDAIETAAYRATGITRKLLGFVRPDAVRFADCDLNAIVDEVVGTLLKGVLDAAGAVVIRDLAPDLGTVRTDRDGVQQVLLNLVKNAADAVAPGGEITVRTRRREGEVTLAVADTGPGLTPDELERVFLPFFTTKARGEGAGLGLSVSYKIVAGLGGRLAVDSTPGAGSVFTIVLPGGAA